jgi:hypothetical protein
MGVRALLEQQKKKMVNLKTVLGDFIKNILNEGRIIPTTNSPTYSGAKDGKWTEPFTGDFILEKTSDFVHKSHTEISAFEVGVTTCVYEEYWSEQMMRAPLRSEVLEKYEVVIDYTNINNNPPEYVYLLTLPKGTYIREYGGNEYRFVMTHDVRIRLIGEMGSMRIKDDSYESKVFGDHTINVFTKKY